MADSALHGDRIGMLVVEFGGFGKDLQADFEFRGVESGEFGSSRF